jgi:hypothetical protein
VLETALGKQASSSRSQKWGRNTRGRDTIQSSYICWNILTMMLHKPYRILQPSELKTQRHAQQQQLQQQQQQQQQQHST